MMPVLSRQQQHTQQKSEQNEVSSRNNIDKVIQAYHSQQRAANAVELGKIKEHQSNHKRSLSYQHNAKKTGHLQPVTDTASEDRAGSKSQHKRPKSNAEVVAQTLNNHAIKIENIILQRTGEQGKAIPVDNVPTTTFKDSI